MQRHSSPTPHRAYFYSLGEPGPAIQHVWICLHGHDQPVANLAAQLVNLDTPERLLILPEAPNQAAPSGRSDARSGLSAVWFRQASLGPDLALMRAYLDELTAFILADCPPDTPLTVLGYGHGAVAAAAWLANNGFAYDRLILYAAVFPPEISRPQLFADLPHAPVVVVATTADVFTPEANGAGLVQDLRAAGLTARLSYADDGPLTLAALGAGREEGGLRLH